MSKSLPKRYVSERAVKKALKINSFRNLSKDKIMEFASMIPYMDKDVAIAAINQFPKFAEFGKAVVERYSEMCNRMFEKNNESQLAVVQGYQTILDALSEKLRNESISESERKSITEDMISVADKIAEADMQNKKFLDRMATKIVFGVLGIVAIAGTAIGVNSKIGNSELPEIADNDDISI